MPQPAASWNVWRDTVFLSATGGYVRCRRIRQLYTNLPANSAVTLAHGLTSESGNPTTPIEVSLDPLSNNNFFFLPQSNNVAWDSQNIYVQVGNIAAGTHSLYVEIVY